MAYVSDTERLDIFHAITVTGRYDTDFGFDTEIGGATLSYTPAIINRHIGELTPVGKANPFTGRGHWGDGGFFPSIDLSAGHVFDQGDNSQLETDEPFLRIIPKISAVYVPNIFNGNLSLKASAGYMISPFGSPPNGYLAEGQISWVLGKFSFGASEFTREGSEAKLSAFLKYQNGQTEYFVEDIDLLSVGLNVKY